MTHSSFSSFFKSSITHSSFPLFPSPSVAFYLPFRSFILPSLFLPLSVSFHSFFRLLYLSLPSSSSFSFNSSAHSSFHLLPCLSRHLLSARPSHTSNFSLPMPSHRPPSHPSPSLPPLSVFIFAGSPFLNPSSSVRPFNLLLKPLLLVSQSIKLAKVLIYLFYE